jgi:hypothetical protein
MKPIRIKLPNKPPKVVQKEQQPDQRQFCVVPIRAATDRTITPMQLRTLMVFCSYANRAGITWVSLKRIGEHLNISVVRTSILTAALISKGYMKVLYKGFAGERAQTRQIVFNQALSLEDIIAVSGEKAPYIEQKEEKEYTKQQLKQQKESDKMARKRKVTDPSVISSDLNNLNPGLSAETIDKNVINEKQVIQLQRAVGADLLQYALSQCGDQPTLEQVQTKLKELLS